MNRTTCIFLGSLTTCCLLASLAGAAPEFVGGATLATAQQPSAAAVGDFNGDGTPDIAVTADTPDRVLVFFGTGGGAFGVPVPIAVPGAGPRDIWATNTDGDGDTDLVVVLHNLNQIQVLVNNGTGVFSLGSSASVGSNARGGVMADFDGNGRMDFATANRDDNTVSVAFNNAGALSSTTFGVGNDPRAVGAGDLDGDTDPDLAVTNHGDRSIGVYRNNAGTFSLSTTLNAPAGTRPTGVTIADVTGDGMADVVATADDANAGIHLVVVYRRTGNMTFAGPVLLNTLGQNPGSVVAGDLDGDGDLEIVSSNEDSGNISVFDNLGAGSFAGAMVIPTGATPQRVTIADVNGGGPDLIIPNRDSNNTTILLNQHNPVACPADLANTGGQGIPDQAVTIDDLLFFIAAFESGSLQADLDNGTGSGISDQAVTIEDLLYMLVHFEGGC